jgi:hypothetical protein
MASYLSAKEEVQLVNGQFICLQKKQSKLSTASYLSAKEEVQLVNGQLSVCKRSIPCCQWAFCLQQKQSKLSMASLSVCRSIPDCQLAICLQK